MFVNLQKLLHLPVFTESGVKLGRIFDLDLEIETQIIARYFVRQNFLSAKSFLIANAQVKEIKNDCVIVYDSVVQAQSIGEMASEE
jgi:sporulation protein YlmC with PRC-barrel domain